MKRLSFILCIITFAFLLSSCKAVNLTYADELLHNNWQVENLSGISAELMFDIPSNMAEFTITDQNGEEISISGVFAVDKENLRITSDTLYKTYTFGYTVYKDRLILTYNGEELTLNAANKKEP